MLRRLKDWFRRHTDDQPAAVPSNRDYVQEREDHRLAQLSAEDEAWGEASRQRDREQQARDQHSPESIKDDGPAPSASP
jgi:hypothetical protein